jgi:hypothetical protein
MWRAETLIREKAKNIHCVVLETSTEWFLVEEFSDFHFDGFALISKHTVTRRRYNQVDRVLEKILRLQRVEPGKVPLSIVGNSQDVFGRLSRMDTLVTVESADETRFLIGNIHRTTSDRLFMKHFTAAGKWFKRPTGIDHSEIGRVAFLDEYGRGWRRLFQR